jgi:short-subunit dehydrogenase|tara:strand:- start:207 stop:1058 length:852 start_codon:yes stop_codon:yes gene_type:complete
MKKERSIKGRENNFKMGRERKERRLAFIVGASSGIGLACSKALAEEGYQTVLFAKRDGIDLGNLAEGIESEFGFRSYHDYFDVSDGARVHEVIGRRIREIGVPDVLINSAGFNRYEPFLSNGMKRQEEIVRVNLLGTMNMVHAVLPSMLDRGRGHIINISSMSAKMGSWGHASYSAAKAGVVALTQGLKAENENIKFTCVLPGIVRTGFYDDYDNFQGTEFKGVIEAEDVSRRIVKEIGKRKPKLEVVIPRHYAVLDFIKLVSMRFAHGIVAEKSKPEPLRKE